MRVEQLAYLIDLFETRSFTKTAERFYMTQQGMSDAIKRMEEELGLELIARSTKGFVFNSYGEAIVAEATNVLAAYKKIEDFAFDERNKYLSSLTETVNVMVHPRLYQFLLSRVIVDFRRKCPKVKLNIETITTFRGYIDALLHETTDVVFILQDERVADAKKAYINREEEAALEEVALRRLAMGVICTEPFHIFSKNSVHAKDIKSLPLVTYDRGLLNLYGDVATHQQVYYSSDSHIHRQVVLDGLAIAAMSKPEYETIFADDIESVRFIPILKCDVYVSALYLKEHQLNRASTFFMELCQRAG